MVKASVASLMLSPTPSSFGIGSLLFHDSLHVTSVVSTTTNMSAQYAYQQKFSCNEREPFVFRNRKTVSHSIAGHWIDLPDPAMVNNLPETNAFTYHLVTHTLESMRCRGID